MMGRPRLHDEHTRAELLAAAEGLVAEGGLDRVSLRAVAEAAGTTTRAVYALFGSKDGLVQALAQRAFELLMAQVDAVPTSRDPGDDLVTASVRGFRRFALEHPELFRLFLTGRWPPFRLSAGSDATRLAALDRLTVRVERASAAGLLGEHPVPEVTLLWDALCTGLAIREICGPIQRSHGDRIWTDALRALLTGLGSDEHRSTEAGPSTARADTGGKDRTRHPRQEGGNNQ